MTHNLHRRGTKENLTGDFTMMAMSVKGVNDAGSGLKKRRFLELAFQNNAINAGAGGGRHLSKYTKEELKELASDQGVAHACFTSKEDVTNMLKAVAAENFGISIIVQGILEDVEDCLRDAGLKPHTVNHSLDIWGKTELLPDQEILEITTMCGHALVSADLTKQCIEDVAAGRMTIEDAAKTVTAPCVCGIFNTKRAQALLERLVAKPK